MAYTRWQANWQTGPAGNTPIVEGFLDHVETALDTQDDRIVSLESGGGAGAFSATIGDGAATAITVTHNLNTFDVLVTVYLNSGTRADEIVDIDRPSVNSVRFTFATAPAVNAYRVVISTGAGSGSDIPATIVDAKGDLIAATAADVVARLPVGANGLVLKANSATTTGLEWAAEAGGSGGAFSATIGDGAATAITVTHNLNTFDVLVTVYLNSGTRLDEIVDIGRPTVNSVQISFATAPAVNAYRVVISAGAGAGSGIPATIVDAKGDLIGGTAADTVARLPVGANGLVLKANSATSTGLEWATDATGSGGHTIQDESVALIQRAGLNFEGAGVTATDDAANNRTTVTIPGPAGHVLQDAGTALPQRAKVNFSGVRVVASDDAVNDRTTVTIQNRVTGTATVASGSTSVVVTHGNTSMTPLPEHVSVTPTNSMGSASKFWISAVGATTFTINVNVDPGAPTATFAWQVEALF